MRMLSRLLGLFLLLACAAAGAQTYPDRAVRLLVPYGAASSTDVLTRHLAEAITAETKQPVIVDNKPGAEGFIGVQAAATAAPDGYTILISTSSTHVVNQHLYNKMPYDPVKDFTPVRTLGQSALGMTVNAGSPFKTPQEFVAAARRQPGKLSFGSATATTRLAAEMFLQQAGVKMLHVPYKSNALMLTALLAGEIDVLFSDTALVIPHIKTGKLRTIGVTGQQRMPALPEVPTLKESGLPDYYLTFWFAAWVPAATPAPVVARINELLARAARTPPVLNFLSVGGAESFDLSGEAFRNFQNAEIAKFGKIVKGANIEPK